MISTSYFTDLFWIKVTLVPLGVLMILIFSFFSVKDILNAKKIGTDIEKNTEANNHVNFKTLGYI